MKPTVRLFIALVFLGLLLGACESGPTPDAEAPLPTGPPWFEEVAAARGLVFEHVSGHRERLVFPEIMGGGVALFDMDADGDLDAYLVQSGDLLDPGSPAGENRLFLNDGTGRFSDVTADSGAGDRGYGMGVMAGDYDNDGDVDLYVTNVGPNALLRNDGAGRFTDVTVAAGVAHDGWGASGAFLDYDNDGDLDLFFTNYVDWSLQVEQTCYNSSGLEDYCLPTNYNTPGADVFFRNEGNGRFSDATEESGLSAAFGNGLGVGTGDFDGNGYQDIFVANDTMLNQLWLNQGDGTYVDESLLRGCALDEHGKAKAGMGVAVDDIDGDADEDIIVVNMRGQTDSVFRNDSGFFADSTGNFGMGQISRWYTRFGIGLVDLDNDGNLDLFEANGRVVVNLEPETDDVFAEPNSLFRGMPGGRFEHVLPQGGTATRLVETSRAAAFGDVDGDGGIDILVVNRDGPAHLFRNIVAERGNWARLRVLDRHGRDALGARVTARVAGRDVTRFVRTAYSYCASNDPAVHFGLGAAERLDAVEVRWPDGTSESFPAVEAGKQITIRQGS